VFFCCAVRRQRLPAGDKRVQRLLLEAPALPEPATASLFRDLLRAGPAWVNTALSTVLAGITARPPDRWGYLRKSPLSTSGKERLYEHFQAWPAMVQNIQD